MNGFVCQPIQLDHTFFTMLLSVVWNLQGVITIDKSDVNAKGQARGSKVKVTEINTKFAPIWAFPDRNSSLNSQMPTKWCAKLLGGIEEVPYFFQGHQSNFEVTWARKQSIWAQFQHFLDDNFSLNSSVWYKTKFGSQNLATKFGSHAKWLPKLVDKISS